MKMRKLLALLLAAAMVFGLVACGAEEAPKETAAETEAEVEETEAEVEETEAEAEETEAEVEETEAEVEETEAEEEAEEAEAEEAEAEEADQATGSTPRNETLYFAGQQWGKINQFNPWGSNNNNWCMSNGREMCYETLFMFNLLNGQLYPLVGESYEWNDDSTVLTVKINADAKFNNGAAVTAEDIADHWAIGEELELPEYIGYAPYIASIEAVDDLTVEFTMVTDEDGVPANPLQALQYLANVFVTNAEYVRGVLDECGGDATAFKEAVMEDYVHTGPYHIYYYDDQKEVFARDDNYWGQAESMWGALPVPKYLAHNIYVDNAAGNVAFGNGEVDMSQQFNIDIPQMMEENPNVCAYIDEAPYNICVSMPSAWFCLSEEGDTALDQVALRQAIAYAVDYDQIVSAAMGGQCPTFTDVPRSVMNPTDGEQKMYDHEAVKDLQWAGNDIERAIEVLDEAGIVDEDGDGWREFNGEKISLTAECPQGWSDWNASLDIVAACGKEIGIEIETYYPEAAQYNTDFQNHDFSICMSSFGGASPVSPWSTVRQLMSSEFVGMSNNGTGNQGWYQNEEADELIKAIPTETDEEKLIEYYTRATEIYLTDVPSFALMYRPQAFHNTNESVWSGFPALGDGDEIPPTVCTDGYGIAALYNLYLVNE